MGKLDKEERREASEHSALSVTLSKVCEVAGWDYGEAWTPSEDSRILKLHSAWYRSSLRGSDCRIALEQFRIFREGFTFPKGTGLPEMVWLSKQAEWIQDLSVQAEDYFSWNRIAQAFGIPVLVKDQILAVLVFFTVVEASQEDRRLELVTAAASQTVAALFGA